MAAACPAQGSVASRRRSRVATVSHNDADLGCQAELSQEELGCPLGALPTKKDSLKGQSHGPTGSQGGRLNNGLAAFNRHQSPQLGDRGVRPPFKRVKPNTLKDYSCSVGLIQEG